MNIKKIISISIAIFVLFAVLPISSISAAGNYFKNVTTGVEYASFSSAVSAASAGDTLLMLDDYASNSNVNVDKSLTVDLDEKTWSASSARTINLPADANADFKIMNGTMLFTGASFDTFIMVRATDNLLVEKMVLNTNNKYNGSYGAVHSLAVGTTISIIDSTIDMGTAEGFGIYSDNVDHTLIIKNTTIYGGKDPILYRKNGSCTIYSGHFVCTNAVNKIMQTGGTNYTDRYNKVFLAENSYITYEENGEPYTGLAAGSNIVDAVVGKQEFWVYEPSVHTHSYVNGVCSCGLVDATADAIVIDAPAVVPAAGSEMSDGKLFVCFKKADGSVVAASDTAEAGTYTALGVSAQMLEGAQVRLKGDFNGIRFLTSIDKADYDVLVSLADKIEIGTRIAPTSLFADDYDNFGYAISEGFYASDDTAYTIAGSLVNIKPGNVDKDFSGQGYVKFTFGDKDVTIFATQIDNSRSIYDLALAALADVSETLTDGYKYEVVLEGDTQFGKFSPYTTEQRSTLTVLSICLTIKIV